MPGNLAVAIASTGPIIRSHPANSRESACPRLPRRLGPSAECASRSFDRRAASDNAGSKLSIAARFTNVRSYKQPPFAESVSKCHSEDQRVIQVLFSDDLFGQRRLFIERRSMSTISSVQNRFAASRTTGGKKSVCPVPREPALSRFRSASIRRSGNMLSKTSEIGRRSLRP